MERYLSKFINKDLAKKIVLISGPRQTGKTTLSKMLTPSFEYLNYDHFENRNRIEKKEWDRKKKLIILDEIHKMPKWKSWLKGIYDVDGIPPKLFSF
jgi:predicted AAA+ superfamily ATPase